MGSMMTATEGHAIRVGRKLKDGRGNEWTVVRLYLARGEAMLRNADRNIVRFFHPIHDRHEMTVVA